MKSTESTMGIPLPLTLLLPEGGDLGGGVAAVVVALGKICKFRFSMFFREVLKQKAGLADSGDPRQAWAIRESK